MDADLRQENPLFSQPPLAKRALRGESGGSPDRPPANIARTSDGDSVASNRGDQQQLDAKDALGERYAQPLMKCMLCEETNQFL